MTLCKLLTAVDSEDCKFNLKPVHWLNKVIYESGECTIYHEEQKLRKKVESGTPDSG